MFLLGKFEGVKWVELVKYIDDIYYCVDGGGYLEKGYCYFFIISVMGGNVC